MSNLQPNCCLKFDFHKGDQHAGGKWLIHDTNRSNGNDPIIQCYGHCNVLFKIVFQFKNNDVLLMIWYLTFLVSPAAW